MDIGSLANINLETPDYDQFEAILGTIPALINPIHPDVLSVPRDIHLNLIDSMSLDTTSFYPPEPLLGDVPVDHAGKDDNLFGASSSIASVQSKVAQLEQLRKHRNDIEEYINTLCVF